MTEPADYKYYKNVQTAQELILRTGNKKFNDITILLEHTEKAGSIPKLNPHLLHTELKNKIPRHDNITHMYFTRSGKIKINTSDPVCAVQITAIDQILNTTVKASIIWEGFTSRFLLFDIPTNVHLADVAIELKNSNDLDIVEIRRFVKPNSRQEASPVLITILCINTPECVKLWFFNHRIQLFIDKPQQCSKCFSYIHLSRFCSSPIRCINCGESHAEQCINSSNCINCKGDHPANSPNCPNFIKEKDTGIRM
ncbi:putative RNA-directed DNA polymerase from transposon X-element [Trichonephila clavipes]|nr:putative RNA-directed DNA polymerase from transposon X-element [Trichonephila clavipes]